MDWLSAAAVIGLSIAVPALAWTVTVLAVRSRREHGQSDGGGSPQGNSDPSQEGPSKASEPSPPPSKPPIGFASARVTFKSAFINGDTQAAIAVLPELERTLGRTSSGYLLSVSLLAGVGEQVDVQPLLDAINSNDASDEPALSALIGGTVQHFVLTDREKDGLDAIGDALERYVHDVPLSKAPRAFIANQLQMLYFGVGQTDKALELINLAIELTPEQPSYYFNLSTIHEERGALEEAVKAIERCVELGKDTPDQDHLFQAWDLYRQRGDEQKMMMMRARLDVAKTVPKPR